jgi:hypothetical protein
VIFLLIGAGLGSVLCFGLAALLGVLALFNVDSPRLGALPAFAFGGVGALGLPLIWYALQRLRGRPPHAWKAGRLSLLLGLLILTVSIGAGQASLNYDLAPEIVIGVAQFFAVLASAAVVLALTALGWGHFTQLRAWGHFLSGAWLAVGAAFFAEVVAVAILAVVGVTLLTFFAPAEIRELGRLARMFQATENPEVLSALIYKPWVVAGVLLTVSVLLPLLEELLKPVGVLLTLRRRPGPMAAFLGGALGGVGFAVTESLLNLSTRQEAWAVLIVARVGTTVMHALTTGLVGWGLGQVMATRRPWRLLGAYSGAVMIHGLWNAGAVGLALGGGALLDQAEVNNWLLPQNLLLAGVVAISGLMLLGLVAAGAAALAILGFRLRQQESMLSAT